MAKADAAQKSPVNDIGLTLAELYNVVDLGFKIFAIYYRVEHLDAALKERLERDYALLWGKYQKIIGTDETLVNQDYVFETYDNLPGVNWEIAQEWLIGEPAYGLNGGPMIGAADNHKAALGSLQTRCYVAGRKTTELAKGSEAEKLCTEAKEALELAETSATLNANYIPEYTLEWDEVDYEVKVNGIYHIAKTKDGSASSKLMAEIMAHKGDGGKTPFTPNFGKTKRPLSQIMNGDLHIDPLLRKIFFKGSNGNTLRFRSPVSQEQLATEGINTFDLDVKLIQNGYEAVPKPGFSNEEAKR